MSPAALLFTPSTSPALTALDGASIDDVFRDRIVAALRDLRAREKRISAAELRLGDAANDSVRFS